MESDYNCEYSSYGYTDPSGAYQVVGVRHCTVTYFLVEEADTEIPAPFMDNWRGNGRYLRRREPSDADGDGLIDCFKSVVPGGNYELSDGKDYGWRTLNGQADFHGGVDISASEGTSIVNAADGRVVEAEFDSNNGNYVRINHSDGTQTVYLHMQQPASVQSGQIVVAGTPLGLVGNTGHSFGAHLHFQIWTKQDGPRNEQTDTLDPESKFNWNC
ncbi:MAG: M23 family metallopeptidase [Luteimonas sp.]